MMRLDFTPTPHGLAPRSRQLSFFESTFVRAWHTLRYFCCKPSRRLLCGKWQAEYECEWMNGKWERYYTFAAQEYICLFYKSGSLISIYTEDGVSEADRDYYSYVVQEHTICTTKLMWKVVRMDAHTLELEEAISCDSDTEYIRTVFSRIW